MISRLHHITQSNFEGADPLSQIEAVCKGGGKCSQLRLKNSSIDDYIKIALEAKRITTKYGAQLIINDNIEVAKYSKADGIHLGQGDAKTTEARNILGHNIIIGRTCNTFEDVLFHSKENVDYVGLGPFRFTNTKKKLSPILGLEGYTKIISSCKENKIDIPIIAIGGIRLEDTIDLLRLGLHGIALASLLNKDNHHYVLSKVLTSINSIAP